MGTTLKFLSENTVRKCTFGNPAGCPDCDYTGYLKTRCELCKGDGEVLMHNDGRIEVLI